MRGTASAEFRAAKDIIIADVDVVAVVVVDDGIGRIFGG